MAVPFGKVAFCNWVMISYFKIVSISIHSPFQGEFSLDDFKLDLYEVAEKSDESLTDEEKLARYKLGMFSRCPKIWVKLSNLKLVSAISSKSDDADSDQAFVLNSVLPIGVILTFNLSKFHIVS